MTTETESGPAATTERGGADQPPPRSAEGETFELKPLEVRIGFKQHPPTGDIWDGSMWMNELFRRLEKRGVDLHRPMYLHIDAVGGEVIVRQEPWRGE